MAIWAIKAYEELYGGLHGMYSLDIVKGSEEFAEDIAKEMSMSVMESYDEISDQLEDDVEAQFDFYGYDCEDEADEEGAKEHIRNEIYSQNMAWDLYELDENKLPTKNLRILVDEFNNDEEDFLKKYAIN